MNGICRFYSLVQDQIFKGRQAGRHPAGVGRLRQNFARVEERSIGGIGRLDGRLAERIKLGRGGIELDDRRRIVAGERVIDEDTQEVAVIRGLRADDDRQGPVMRPRRRLRASYNGDRGPRTSPSSSWMMRLGDRPKAVFASADRAR